MSSIGLITVTNVSMDDGALHRIGACITCGVIWWFFRYERSDEVVTGHHRRFA
jgi:hypothetical protein